MDIVGIAIQPPALMMLKVPHCAAPCMSGGINSRDLNPALAKANSASSGRSREVRQHPSGGRLGGRHEDVMLPPQHAFRHSAVPPVYRM